MSISLLYKEASIIPSYSTFISLKSALLLRQYVVNNLNSRSFFQNSLCVTCLNGIFECQNFWAPGIHRLVFFRLDYLPKQRWHPVPWLMLPNPGSSLGDLLDCHQAMAGKPTSTSLKFHTKSRSRCRPPKVSPCAMVLESYAISPPFGNPW